MHLVLVCGAEFGDPCSRTKSLDWGCSRKPLWLELSKGGGGWKEVKQKGRGSSMRHHRHSTEDAKHLTFLGVRWKAQGDFELRGDVL